LDKFIENVCNDLSAKSCHYVSRLNEANLEEPTYSSPFQALAFSRRVGSKGRNFETQKLRESGANQVCTLLE
jgi:hypothetical protein